VAITVRPALAGDIPAMAAIRALEWETADYWLARIGGYLDGSQSPQQALRERAMLVADDDGTVIGFVAGHRTRRHGCDGELEWINVAPGHRGRGVADALLEAMGAWFVAQGALRVCVDVNPANVSARRLYARFGAVPLNPHWMVWEDTHSLCAGPGLSS
jgi:GNAT superfamily N-acetyltransferase